MNNKKDHYNCGKLEENGWLRSVWQDIAKPLKPTKQQKQDREEMSRFYSFIHLVVASSSRKGKPLVLNIKCEFQKLLMEKIETWPDKADMGYQIIGICRNLRLDYFSVFALLDYVAGQFCSNRPIRPPFILRIFESPLHANW